MLTPQSNVTLADIASCIRSHNSFVLCGHVNPDGDCLGSQVAMAALLRLLGKEVVCLLAKPNPVEVNLSFLMEKEPFVFAQDYQGEPDVFIALDVPSFERLGDAAAIAKNTPVSLTIDHHACDTPMSQMVYVDPDAPACCCLVWDLAKELDAIDQTVALGALTGLMTDTGRFAYQNTTPEAFEAAAEMMRYGADPSLVSREFFQNRTLASYQLEQRMLERLVLCEDGAFAYSYLSQQDFQDLNAIKGDAEILIDELRSIAGVRIALILKENEEGKTRGSLRAKDDSDVAQIARIFNGGGHRAAAGFTFEGSLEQALVDVPALVKKMLF